VASPRRRAPALYEQIRRLYLDAGVLHADETGWRVKGQTWRLWCFTCANATYYQFDASRGHAALDQFFVDEFRGILVTDFSQAAQKSLTSTPSNSSAENRANIVSSSSTRSD
jgi:hypothetical protein